MAAVDGPRAKGRGASCVVKMWVIRAERHEHRYSALIDGERVGHAACVQIGDIVVVPHLYVESAYRATGLELDLVRAVCRDAQNAGLAVLTESAFMQRFAYLHPGLGGTLRMPYPGEIASILPVIQAAEEYEEIRLAGGPTLGG